MAPSDSEPRPPAGHLRPSPASTVPAPACVDASEERAPAAATSHESPGQPPAAEPRPVPPPEKTKDRTPPPPPPAAAAQDAGGVELPRLPAAGEESARERLKRHRTEMAGRVRIPEMWGQERLLKDWADCAVFDRPLAATAGLLTARNALVAECVAARRPTGRPLRVHNGCS